MSAKTRFNNWLRKLKVEEVSLVDAGANQHADHVVRKHLTVPGDADDSEPLFTELTQAVAGLGDVAKNGTLSFNQAASIDALWRLGDALQTSLRTIYQEAAEGDRGALIDRALAEYRTALDALPATGSTSPTQKGAELSIPHTTPTMKYTDLDKANQAVAKLEEALELAKRAPAAGATNAPEDIYKGLPQPVVDLIKSQAAALDTLTKAAEEAKIEKDAADLVDGTPVDVADAKVLLKALKGSDDAQKIVGKMFDQFAAAIENGGATVEKGAAGASADGAAGEGDPVAELATLAKAFRAENAKLTQEQAEALVFENRPDLYNAVNA